MEAFKMVSQVVNEDVENETAEEIINELIAHNTDIYSGEIGALEYQFRPFVELSQGVSESHIEIPDSRKGKT